jgi:uncharacterized membrane protein YgcG
VAQVFATREELAAHIKSDWHKHNLTLKASAKAMLTKEQYLDLQLMLQQGVGLGGADGGGGGKGGGKSGGGGGKKGKGRKDVDLWE